MEVIVGGMFSPCRVCVSLPTLWCRKYSMKRVSSCVNNGREALQVVGIPLEGSHTLLYFDPMGICQEQHPV